MLNLSKNFKNNSIPLIVLILIIVFSHYFWFFSLDVITSGDWWFHYIETMEEWFSKPYSWNSQTGLGRYIVSPSFYGFKSIFGLLSRFNLNFNLSERVLFLWPSVLFSSLGMYLLSIKLFNKKEGSLIASLIYSLNTYILIIFGVHLTVAMAYSLLPIIFYLFMKTIENLSFKKSVITGVILSISFTYEPRISYITSAILLFFSIYSLNFKKFKKYWFITLTPFIIVFLIHSFWIIPSYTLKYSTLQSIFAEKPWISFMNMDNSILLSHPFWTGKKPTEFVPTQPKIFMFLYPILAFLSLFLLKKDDKKIIFFLVFLALIGIFLVKQENPPFGDVYTWLFHNLPGFNMFREASKFYILTAFSYALLTACTIKRIENIKFSKYLIFLIILILLYMAKPAFTSELERAYKPVKIPQEYIELKDFIYSQESFFRTYWYPRVNRFGFYSNMHPSIDHVNEMINGRLNFYLTSPNSFSFLPDQDTFNNILDALSVKYVIVPYDSQNETYRYYGPREQYIKTLKESHSYLEEIEFSENISIFENFNYQDHFYIINDFYQPIDQKNIFTNHTKPQSHFCSENSGQIPFSIPKNSLLIFEEDLVIDNYNKTKTTSAPKIENNFTVSVCVYPNKNTDSGDIVAKRYNLIHVDYGLIYFIDTSNKIKFGATMNNGSNIYFSDKTSYDINNWYHVLSTYDSKSLRLYVDGISSYEINATGDISTSNALLSIGKMAGFDSWFNGTISDIKIYNKTLGQEDILFLSHQCKKNILFDSISDNYGISFNGTNNQNSYIYIFPSKKLNFNSSFSISTLVYPEKMNGSGDILAKRYGYLTQYGIIYKADENGISFGASIFNNTNIYFFDKKSRPFDNWYLVTITYDEKDLRLYVNNQMVKQVEIGGNIEELNVPILVGKSSLSNTYFNGTIKDIKFYNQSIYYDQIKTEYDPSFPYNKSYIENFDKVEKIPVNYEFINPTLYKVKVQSEKPFMLSFAESYDPLWAAKVKQPDGKWKEYEPIPLYSVINGFWIEDTGDLEITIEYKPQRWFYTGLIISLTTLAACISYLIYGWKRGFFKRICWKVIDAIKDRRKFKYSYKG